MYLTILLWDYLVLWLFFLNYFNTLSFIVSMVDVIDVHITIICKMHHRIWIKFGSQNNGHLTFQITLLFKLLGNWTNQAFLKLFQPHHFVSVVICLLITAFLYHCIHIFNQLLKELNYYKHMYILIYPSRIIIMISINVIVYLKLIIVSQEFNFRYN